MTATERALLLEIAAKAGYEIEFHRGGSVSVRNSVEERGFWDPIRSLEDARALVAGLTSPAAKMAFGQHLMALMSEREIGPRQAMYLASLAPPQKITRAWCATVGIAWPEGME